MLIADAHRLAETLRLPSDRTPVVAFVDSGLDPFAALPSGTRVRAARSFVDEDVSLDTLGWGTRAVIEHTRMLTRDWGTDGWGEVEIVVAKVLMRDGAVCADAVARALAWVASLGVDAVIAPWIAGNPSKPGRVVARRRSAGALALAA